MILSRECVFNHLIVAFVKIINSIPWPQLYKIQDLNNKRPDKLSKTCLLGPERNQSPSWLELSVLLRKVSFQPYNEKLTLKPWSNNQGKIAKKSLLFYFTRNIRVLWVDNSKGIILYKTLKNNSWDSSTKI